MNKFFVASIAAILIAPAYSAHDISGKIVDQSGNPIANVKIEFHGSNLTIYSDKQGQFSVSESIDHVDEIHISARGYNHLSFKLEDQTDKTLSSIFLDQTIVLTPAIIEHIDVYATPLHGSTLESATPITVLSDSDLKTNTAQH
ncbi:carboxypeptidase-like regulatory domain-containing protein [Psychrosphaera algicola]|uniref:Carboxypeptidase-like regulatory domain-containing protein n=1 Tax=Psychrosphaera algicola TaxID=3023714 RepID=A0ABT5FGA6_9GAMM|nr:carboxypeptidase-like regulatory domain-containing protein [Psychrosphaera sp. G1-22]MDC2890057.1 carboxypeptidase-like regulatory domain-containing protein [Psychrosphaera sp. G1-22]